MSLERLAARGAEIGEARAGVVRARVAEPYLPGIDLLTRYPGA